MKITKTLCLALINVCAKTLENLDKQRTKVIANIGDQLNKKKLLNGKWHSSARYLDQIYKLNQLANISHRESIVSKIQNVIMQNMRDLEDRENGKTEGNEPCLSWMFYCINSCVSEDRGMGLGRAKDDDLLNDCRDFVNDLHMECTRVNDFPYKYTGKDLAKVGL